MTKKQFLVVGAHGAGNTWVLNIIRTLLIDEFPDDPPLSGWLEKEPPLHLCNLIRPHHWVLKCHGFKGIQNWVEFTGCKIVRVDRNADDCIKSVRRRLNLSHEDAEIVVGNDLFWLDELKFWHARMDYEGDGISSLAAAQHLANQLGYGHVPSLRIAEIANMYSKRNVRAFTAGLQESDPAVGKDEYGILFHKDTLFQRNHIGA